MKIALAGFGQEGRVSYEYWNRDGNILTVASESEEIEGVPSGVATILGPDAFLKLNDFDLIIRSPGINPKKLPYGEKVWSATNEFFDKCPADVIGVTGTKGKGTTSSLIASILSAAGKKVHLVGNIGKPALGVLSDIGEDDIVVYELSSFQLWDVKYSPRIAIILGIEADHLDVHDSFEDYIEAKSNIRRYQDITDECYYHPANENSLRIASTAGALLSTDAELKQWTQNIYRYSSEESICVNDDWFVDNVDRQIAPVSSLRLPGRHNVENACAAIAAAQDYTADTAAFKAGLEDFTGLPHRLKFVAEKDRVKYYDDSIATTPGSAIAAIYSFEEPKVIILGGKDKGADYTELIESCARSATTVIAIGTNGPAIAARCTDAGVACVEEHGDMTTIVARAASIAQSGSVVILCPAASSFDMFKSYADRGDQFIAAVNTLNPK